MIEFLTKLVKFFKIANVKGQFEDVYTKDETTAVLSSPDDERLPFCYKQSIFDPRPENCLSFSKKLPPKIV